MVDNRVETRFLPFFLSFLFLSPSKLTRNRYRSSFRECLDPDTALKTRDARRHERKRGRVCLGNRADVVYPSLFQTLFEIDIPRRSRLETNSQFYNSLCSTAGVSYSRVIPTTRASLHVCAFLSLSLSLYYANTDGRVAGIPKRGTERGGTRRISRENRSLKAALR